MSAINMIERYGVPSKHDQLPYGTSCKVINHSHDEYDLYLQVGEDEDDPKWELLETFNSQSIQDYVNCRIEDRLRKNIHYD